MKFSSVAPGLGGPQLETRKALLLIDLQNDFVDQAGKLFVPNTAKFLNKLPTLINRFRTKGDVFFINTEYSNPRSLKTNITIQQPSVHHHTPTSPAEASMIAGGKLASDVEAFLTPPYNTQASWSQCCLPGSFGSLLPDVLSFSENQSKDMQIVKSYYSPFPDVSFLLHLRKQLVTKLYICGSLSNISVYATVIDAVSHEMSVTIVEDCVGYRDEYCHLEAMRQMADQMEASRISYHELMDDLVRDNDFDAQYEVAFQHVSPSQGLAPGLFPSSWQLPCATNVQEQLFGHTLIAFDCGLLPFGSFQQDSLAAGEQLVQGHDMMAALKGRDCEDRSEAKVLHGILLDVEHPKIELSASAQDHTYVYFCIYENCSTVFREQREWERHDLRSHDAQQYWICQQKAISHMDGQSATCYNISHDRTLHETHVRRHHKVSFEDLVKEYSARDCVNNNHQPQYFCGFCTSPVQYNKEKGKPGWRERFDHLAKHMERGDKLHRPGHEYIKEQEAAALMHPKNTNDISIWGVSASRSIMTPL
jgi:nicotinamidase-related amidase